MKNMKALLAVVTWALVVNSGFAADKTPAGDAASKAPQKRVLKIDANEVDMNRLEKEGSYRLNQVTRRQKLTNGKEIDVKFDRRAQYFPKSKRIAYIESALYNDASQGHLKVYDENGVKVFEKKLEPEKGVYRNFQAVHVIGGRYLATFTQDVFTEPRQRFDVYNINSNRVIFSTTCSYASSIKIPPSEDYLLLTIKEPGGEFVEIYKYDFVSFVKIAAGDGLFVKAISNDGKSYLIGKTNTIDTQPTEYPRYVTRFSFFTDDLPKGSADTVEFEFPKGTTYSVNGRYLIFSAETDATRKGKKIVGTSVYSIFDAATAKILAEGKLSPETVEKYLRESASGGRK